MYQTHGKINGRLLCRFDASTNIKPLCAWKSIPGSSGIWRAGVTNGGTWKQIEQAWGEDSTGQWLGAPPPIYQAVAMRVLTSVGAIATRERQGFDMVTHVASGAAFFLDWQKQFFKRNDGGGFDLVTVRDGTNSRFSIYNAATGTIVRQGIGPVLPLAQASLPDGSYAVYVYHDGIVEGLRLPPEDEYFRDPEFDYQTQDGRTSHFNPFKYAGEIPLDPNHPLRVKRRQLIAENKTEDVAEWIIYITQEGARQGEGSMLKLQIGGGTWTIAPGVFVSPARPLYRLDFTLPTANSPSTPIPVFVDALARAISYPLKTRGGRHLIGGARMNENGTHPAVWEWDENTGTATILGVAENACDPICEELLSTGLVTGMVECADGEIVITTLCSRHRLAEGAIEPEKRLPRWPKKLDGEPGGRSLIVIDDNVSHLTEKLGNKSNDKNSAEYYGLLVNIAGEKLEFGPGTIAHVDSALWTYLGKAFGVRGDKALSETGGKCYVTFYDGEWNKSARGYRIDWLFLQRGISVNGRNLTFGYQPVPPTTAGENIDYKLGTGLGRCLRDDGSRIQVLESDYRVRSLFLTEGEYVGYQQAVAPCRKVIDSQTMEDHWCLVAFDGLKTEDGVSEQFPGNGTTPGVPPAVPSGVTIFWRALELPHGYEAIYQVHSLDISTNKILTTRNNAASNWRIRARVDSNALTTALETYIYPVPLGKPFIPPIPAREKIEFVIFWDDNDGAAELPLFGQRA